MGGRRRRVVEGEEPGGVRCDLEEVVGTAKQAATRLDQGGMGVVQRKLGDGHAGRNQQLEALVVAVWAFGDDGELAG